MAKLSLILVTWLVAIGVGTTLVMRHERQPGQRATGATSWPSGSQLAPGEESTVVVFLHPQCPCSRAALKTLRQVIQCEGGQASCLWVVLVCPPGAADGFDRSPFKRLAAAIPGARLFVDREGKEGRRFGVRTSGQVMAYRVERLVFSGGITPGRGTYGENAGADALRAVLRGEQPATTASSVFGCPLFDETDDE